MEQNSLVEKLSLQAESFQEGFETLTKSSSFERAPEKFPAPAAWIFHYHQDTPASQSQRRSTMEKYNIRREVGKR